MNLEDKNNKVTKRENNSWHAKQLSLLHELFISLTSTLDEPELLNRASTIISKGFERSVVAINILDESKQEFVLTAYSAKASKEDIRSRIPTDQGVIGQSAKLRQAVVVLDTSQCDFYVEKFSTTRSEIACPIIHGEELFGVLNIESEVVNNFTANDVKAVEIFAGTLAIAIQNSRAFHRVEALSKTKDALLERLSHDYQNIFENAMQGMSRSTPNGKFLIANHALARILGYSSPEELLDIDIPKDIFAKADKWLELIELIECNGSITDAEAQFKKRDGQIIDVKINARIVRDGRGRTLYYDSAIEDISESKRLQRELQRRERMAMMGELAAAIAHEIRNPLAAVINSAEELQARFDFSGTNRRLLEIILEEAERLERVVRDFLIFARPSQPRFAVSDINSVVEKTIEIAIQSQQIDAHNLKFKKNLSQHLPQLYIDSDLILQVLLNVFLNAMQALKHDGQIEVCTKLDPSQTGWTHEPYLLIEVKDSGAGIKGKDLERVFEPFFTTKSSGTGLGLPIARQIVDMHHGIITIESIEGTGTTVRIYLPVSRNIE